MSGEGIILKLQLSCCLKGTINKQIRSFGMKLIKKLQNILVYNNK
jgi:hypothetical protein